MRLNNYQSSEREVYWTFSRTELCRTSSINKASNKGRINGIFRDKNALPRLNTPQRELKIHRQNTPHRHSDLHVVTTQTLPFDAARLNVIPCLHPPMSGKP